jgi:sulfoxide reductase heme-binding subunit YedZ
MHWDLDSIMLWLRVTARFSGIFLAASLAAPALALLWPSSFTQWMASNRHRFTLLFAFSHTLHLGGVMALISLRPAQFFSRSGLVVLIGGGLGYGLIYYLVGMALLRRKTPEMSDSKMQVVSSYILWAAFTLAFSIGLLRTPWIYAPMVAIMVLALSVRIFAKHAAAARRQSSVTT